VAAFLVVFLVGVSATPAPAQDSTPTARAIVLASPAVVSVAVNVTVSVGVSDPTLIGLLHARTLKLRLGTIALGSGMIVHPGGIVVTASHVVQPDEQEMRNCATNQIFFSRLKKRFGTLSKRADLCLEYRTDGAAANSLLHGCYTSQICQFTIQKAITVFTARKVVGPRTAGGLPAQVKLSTGFDTTDVAILQVNATDLPTIPLAPASSDLQIEESVTALGFPGRSSEVLVTGVAKLARVFGRVLRLPSSNGTRAVVIDVRTESGMGGGPVLDDHGDAVGLLSYSTVGEHGNTGESYMRSVDDIQSALRSAGYEPARGDVDTEFQQAMTYFWGRHYTAAIPALHKVLNLYDGHPLATNYLVQAQAKVGGPDDMPLAPVNKSDFRSAVAFGTRMAGALGALLALLACVGLFIVRQRRRS
jgi:S1-C subfamily serine protease